MPDILHDFVIRAAPDKVIDCVSTPKGLDAWWTSHSSGDRRPGSEFDLSFGPGYDWKARVTKFVTGQEFELQMTHSDSEWKNTRLHWTVQPEKDFTRVRFSHSGWPEANEHFRISSYCWAAYLRILKRHLEFGEEVPFERRLDV